MADALVVQVDFEGGNEPEENVLQIPFDITWVDFELLLKLTFDCEKISLKYLDEDNDLITLSNAEDLAEAVRVANKCGNTLQVKLTPIIPPPCDIVFEDLSQVIMDTKDQTVSMKTQNTSTAMDTDAGKTDNMPIIITDEVGMELPDNTNQVVKDKEETDKCMASQPAKPEPASVQRPDGPFQACNQGSGGVLDVAAWGREGTRVIQWAAKTSSNGNTNQLFYLDAATHTIRNIYCGLCLQANEKQTIVSSYKAGEGEQKFVIDGNKIVRFGQPDLVLSAPNKAKGTDVVMVKYTGAPEQHWTFYYRQETLCDVELSSVVANAKPVVPPRKKLYKDYYSQLARDAGASVKVSSKVKTCQGRGMSASMSSSVRPQAAGQYESLSVEDEEPPAWLHAYMEKFKAEICEDIAGLVARQTVRQVLTGLEGAVITSITGSRERPETPGTSEADNNPTATNPLATNSSSTTYAHLGVVCDSCDKTIVGVRYKCGNCEDYDLCEGCEAQEGVHDSDHVFLKIRRPTMGVGRRRNGRMAPVLKRSIYSTAEDLQKSLAKQEKRQKRQDQKDGSVEELKKWEQKMKRRDEKLKRRLEHIKDTPHKKERLDLPQFQMSERMDAVFVQDLTIPDGTHVQPGTKLTKRWLIKNMGTHPWTSKTKLKLMYGNIPCVQDEVSVPYLAPEEDGTVAVELTAPQQPGVYQSHWRLHHHNTRFGHRVWCSVVVDEREVLEPTSPTGDDSLLKLDNGQTQASAECVDVKQGDKGDGEEAGSVPRPAPVGEEEEDEDQVGSPARPTTKDKSILSPGDIMSFEMLDIRDTRDTPKVSQTATPTNTPLGVSPPKSPTAELDEAMQQLSTSSSVEVVSSEVVTPDEMTELVQERIASLGLKPVPVDIESISSISEDSDSDSDFYVVPLPDCFNTNLPMSASASTSVIISKEELKKKTIDDLLLTSNRIDTPFLEPTSVDDEDLVHVQPPVVEAAVTAPAVTAEVPVEKVETPEPIEKPTPAELRTNTAAEPRSKPQGEARAKTRSHDAGAESGNDADTEETDKEEPQEQTTRQQEMEDETDGIARDTDMKQAEPVGETGVTDDTEDDNNNNNNHTGAVGGEEGPRERRASSNSPPRDLAVSVLTAAMGVASQAAATAYSTAKDVFHTLQAKNQYVPPKSEWTPAKDAYIPPTTEYTYPQQEAYVPPQPTYIPPEQIFAPSTETYTPPSQTYTPPTQKYEPPRSDPRFRRQPRCDAPMQQLVEMGFANRELNERLLKKHNDCVEDVIQDLVQAQDNDWFNARH